jgi:predicted ATPase/DNA-binding winged helix-turn-helix (wHTH) protein
MSDPPTIDRCFAFAPFRLYPARRMLLEEDRQVRLGGRALDILIALVEHASEVVSKDNLMASVWSGIAVEEGSLRVHIAALRRSLGDGRAGRRYVVNVQGRGYCFVAPVSVTTEESAADLRPAGKVRRHDLPISLTRTVGRVDEVDGIVAELPRRRFMTIVGPGGIGKTTVALAVAEAVARAYPDGVRFVDLAPVSNPQLVPSTLAAAVGVVTPSGDVVSSLVAFLRDRRMLIVLDGCEHVLEIAATFAERVFRYAPGVHILATSREPLSAEGEWVRRLQALAIAPPSAGIGAQDAIAFPAIELFVERASAVLDSFQLTDDNAPLVASICRKLDGIPLAIELVAGRLDTFGIAGLASLLDDRFSLFTSGRRTSVPRHRTMSAALEWSYGWLPEAERVVLRRLAVLAGAFGLEAAYAVGADACLSKPHLVECLANLVTKSLVAADIGGPAVSYRLLDTTRAYGRERLLECDEYDDAARRHAAYFLAFFEKAEAELEMLSLVDWRDRYGGQIDNLRAALDWAFSEAGNPSLGIDLAIAGAPVWFQLTLVEESREQYDRAIAHLDAANADARQRMRIIAVRSCVISGQVLADGRNPLAVVLELAEGLGDLDHQALALWALFGSQAVRGQMRQAAELAAKFQAVADVAGDAGYQTSADRMFASLSFEAGDLGAARQRVERILTRPAERAKRAPLIHRHMEQHANERSMLSILLTLQGFPEHALRVEAENYARALRTGHALSLVNQLRYSGCFTAIYAGDIDQAGLSVEELVDLSAKHEIGISLAIGRCYQGKLGHLRGEAAAGLAEFRDAIDAFRAARYAYFFPLMLGNFAEALGDAGETSAGLATIEAAIGGAEALEQHWYMAELLRIRGVLMAAAGDTAGAGQIFGRALDLAHRQGALAWELRVSCDLAKLCYAEGHARDARQILSVIRSRFTEGFGRPDLLAADRLLEAWAQ